MSTPSSANIPSLPQVDSFVEQRRAQLEKARQTYQFDYSYEDIGYLKGSPPAQDSYSGQALRILLQQQLKFMLNHILASATPADGSGGGGDGVTASIQEAVQKFQAAEQMAKDADDCLSVVVGLIKWFASVVKSQREMPGSLQNFQHMFQVMNVPPAAKHWDDDWYFAYLMVTGPVPNHLVCIEKIPENFPVSDEVYRRVTGDGGGLELALLQKRVFLADFSLFAGLSGHKSYGDETVTVAPMALFVWTDTKEFGGFGLRPVAIQCGQVAGPDAPLFTPHSGWCWKMARLCVLSAMGLYSGTSSHLGTHILMERLVICTYRALATNHPIYVLLNPNFQYTLAVNVFTKAFSEPKWFPKLEESYLITLMSTPRDQSMDLLRRYMDTFRLNRSAPPQMFEDRGTLSPEVLPMYPFRDDTMKIWKAIHDFASAYVDVYYADDGAVRDDVEIQVWVRELQDGGDQGGRLRGIGVEDPSGGGGAGVVKTKQALVDLVAQIIYQASAYHTALNYSCYEFMSYALGVSYSGFQQPPTSSTPNTEAEFVKRFPPMGFAWTQFHFVTIQYSLWENQLGVYPSGTFADPRVQGPSEAFAARMREIEAEINAENGKRPLPYEYQLPSMITASLQN